MDYVEIFNICFNIYLFIFSDYVNKYLASNKNLEQDWVLKALPVSFYLFFLI